MGTLTQTFPLPRGLEKNLFKMKDYIVVYKKGDSINYTCPDKHSLIKELFDGDEDRFKSEVIRLMWESVSTQYIEDIQTGKGYAEINSADVNPYGWRNT